MPAGVGGRAINGLAYFHNDGVGDGMVMLSVWVVFCIGAIFSLDRIAASTVIVHVAHRGKLPRAGA
ncbi:hypothetical protein EDD90_0607 [Streptomyces sp. Ag109_O5-1]|uniref:hypothetical protein n=1 Tax=Streptomyces sp. Ag109_O5-1 TaxID=1938851 RepID=UPI000F509FA6|nr:hypothetical protein [Streptomyces sp. Ag109_O5-1]RPE37747.1 hypothetical protein EDD90_0607 [Streptomyces sp. Ag109_O5-1]